MKILILSVVPIAAFVIGTWIARKNSRPPKEDREELLRLRTLVGTIRMKAAEHSVLGDDFAVITLGIIADSEAGA